LNPFFFVIILARSPLSFMWRICQKTLFWGVWSWRLAVFWYYPSKQRPWGCRYWGVTHLCVALVGA